MTTRHFKGKERGEREIMPEDTKIGKFSDGILNLKAFASRIIQSKGSKEDKCQVSFECPDFPGIAILHDFTLTGDMWALHNAMRTTGVLTEKEVELNQEYDLEDEQIIAKCNAMAGTALVSYDAAWDRTKLQYFVTKDDVKEKKWPKAELMPENSNEPASTGVFED